MGRVPDARDWASDAGVSPDDDLTFLREFEHATLARVLLAEGVARPGRRVRPRRDRPRRRLAAAAETGGRNGSLIDILVVLALARTARGDRAAAAAALDRATSLAAPEGFVRVFLDEGQPMTALLTSAAGRSGAPGYVRELLAAANPRPRPPSVRQPLVEPLSLRELDVLRLLGSELDGPGIARELGVSLNTLRTHTKNVYAKLGVNSRRAAVGRAAQLDLLARRDR